MYDRPPMPLPMDSTTSDEKKHPKINKLINRFKKITHKDTELKQTTPLEQQALQSTPDVTPTADIFSTAIATGAPPSMFANKTHQVTPQGLINNNGGKPIGTNKFYANFLLGNQTLPAWPQPHSIWFSKDPGYEGLGIHHVPASDIVSGPDASANPVQFFFGPNGVKSIVFGSEDFDNNTSLKVLNINHMSTDIQLQSRDQGYLTVPLVQGAGFVTGIYYNLIPKITSVVGFASVRGDTSPRTGIQKYKVTLNNNRIWTLYIAVPSGQKLTLALKNGAIVTSNSVNGAVFQIVASDSNAFDDAAGAYPTRAAITGSTSGNTGNYSIVYSVTGSSNSGKAALFALPHHVNTLTGNSATKTNLQLQTITKGIATGFITNRFDFKIDIPADKGLDPYSAIGGVSLNYSNNVLSHIRAAAQSDVARDVAAESNVDSMYFGGKVLAKYAWVLYVTHYVLKDASLTNTLLPKLKTAIERFSNNRQQFPLAYDTTWRGIVSTADPAADFGNAFYNDHHFHYGYHILASAITAKVDKELGGSWINSVKAWVTTLARDIATTFDGDDYFPAFRSFDWYNGHSWAKGVYESGDGKDQESSSEDYNAYLGLKIWGNVGDSALEARSNIQLGILRHTVGTYFLLLDSNTVQPKNFIKNKVTGILFENKVDHTTYFGNNLEYIQMIHAIPVTSLSSYFRSPQFVQEEWNEKLKAIVGNVNDGWKGIIYLNVALFDPNTSWNFFSGSSFQDAYLDGGQSKTWSLTYSGAFASA